MNSSLEREGQDQLIPLLWIRRSIGFVGILFPLLLITGAYLFGNCKFILGSISDYYHTVMDDLFVAVLCILSVFLFSYRGPEKKDAIASNLAALFALGIAFFPTDIKTDQLSCVVHLGAITFKQLHNLFSAGFFLLLSYFALVLFPKTKPGHAPSAEKLQRNRLYRICGYTMLLCIIVIAGYMIFLKNKSILKGLPVIFIFEWIALWAFGISWIVKGGWFLTDK